MPNELKIKRVFVRKSSVTDSDKSPEKKRITLIRKKPPPKRFQRATNAQEEMAVIPKPYWDKDGNIECPSCRKKIHESNIREHLKKEHSVTERELKLFDYKSKAKPLWIQIWSGGLPSLGKRSR